MPIRRMLITLGRVHVAGNLFTPADADAEEFAAVIRDFPSIDFRGYTWHIGDVVVDDVRQAVGGRLGKVHDRHTEEPVWDEQRRSFRDVECVTREIAYSNFSLHVPSRIIAFEERKGAISASCFANRFADMAEQSTSVESLAIDLVLDEAEALQELLSFDSLKEITFSLVPTNPSYREDYQDAKDIVEETRAEKALLRLKSREDEGLVVQGTMIEQAARMASDGYGEFTAEGQVGQVMRYIRSKMKAAQRYMEMLDAPRVFVEETIDWIIQRGGRRDD